MPRSFNNVWIHAVWATKYRLPLIDFSIEQKVYSLITEKFNEIESPVSIINGMPDHVHCLFRLNPNKTISSIMKHVKGSSSRYINSNNLISEEFGWQKSYATFSVSEKDIKTVYHYIKNQKDHHFKKSFLQEFNEMVKG